MAWGDEEKTRCVYKRGTGVSVKEAEINVYEGTIGMQGYSRRVGVYGT